MSLTAFLLSSSSLNVHSLLPFTFIPLLFLFISKNCLWNERYNCSKYLLVSVQITGGEVEANVFVLCCSRRHKVGVRNAICWALHWVSHGGVDQKKKISSTAITILISSITDTLKGKMNLNYFKMPTWYTASIGMWHCVCNKHDKRRTFLRDYWKQNKSLSLTT